MINFYTNIKKEEKKIMKEVIVNFDWEEDVILLKTRV